jgi:hypothetical protein
MGVGLGYSGSECVIGMIDILIVLEQSHVVSVGRFLHDKSCDSR